jgi:hypothetical protein
MARSATSTTATLAKAIGTGITVTDPGAGEFTVLLDSGDSLDLIGDFYHEVEIIDSGDRVSTPHTGILRFTSGLIRPV